jgi:DNA-directed RNA polymerase specialized sigma24 family protein
MTVRLRYHTPAEEADAIVTANYMVMMEEILRSVGGRLRAEGITTLIRQDLEVAYNEGWQCLTQHIIQGRPVMSLAALLSTMVHRRAIDLYRAKQEARRVEMDLEQQGVELDLAARVDDQEKLTKLLDRLKDRLNDKERRAVTLCLLHGYRRQEAADLLGIDRVVFERIMDGAMKKMAGVIACIEARGCGGEEWSRLMRAYALGMLSEGEPDYQRALQHVDGAEPCEACRRYVHGLRGLAAVLPPLPPRLLDGHGAGNVLAHVSRWLGGGNHATAVLQGAGVAGAGGGTAVGVAVGGGAKALVLAGAVALSIAGGAAVVATEHRTGPDRHRHAHVARPDAVSVGTPVLPTGATLMGDAPPRPTSNIRVGYLRPADPRRERATAEFARAQHPAAAKEDRPSEFSWERPTAESTQRYPSHTARSTSATTPPSVSAVVSSRRSVGGASRNEGAHESAEFSFEK